MGGGDLNLKKSWHPHTAKNQERVWKAEQIDAAEKRKLAELQKEIHDERNREELKRIGQSSGVLKQNDDKKLEWMYSGAKELINREEYLLGRTIDKHYEQLDQQEKEQLGKSSSGLAPAKNHVEHECIPFSIRHFKGEAPSNDQVDLSRKLMEDPLMSIKQREMDSRRKLLENPVKLKELHRLLKQDPSSSSKHKSKKNRNKSKKSKKKKSRSDGSSDSDEDLDKLLTEKYKKIQGDINEDDEEDGKPIDINKLLSLKYDKLNKELDKMSKKKKVAKQRSSDEEESRNRSKDYESKRYNSRYVHDRSDSYQRLSDRNYDYRNSDRYNRQSRDNEYYSRQRERSRSRSNDRSRKRSRSHDISRRPETSRKRSSSRDRYNDRLKKSGKQQQRSPSVEKRLKRNPSPDRNVRHHGRESIKTETFINKKRRSSSSSSSPSSDSSRARNSGDDSDTNIRQQKRKFGLVTASGKKLEVKKFTAEERAALKPAKVEKPKWQKPEKSNLSVEEKKMKLLEMMNNAGWRDQEREKNVKRYRAEEEREHLARSNETFDKNFLTKQLNKATKDETVESRIKSKINNIQRSGHSMNANFVRR